jgi:hypothetical protein
VAIVTFVWVGTLEKSNVSLETMELIQVLTLVADVRETPVLPILSPKLILPMKSISPLIGPAA